MSGYKIINLNNSDFTVDGDAVVVPGSHDAVENNYRKATMVYNFSIGGVESPAQYVAFQSTGGVYTGLLYVDATTFKMVGIEIDADDNVKLKTLASE